MNAQNGHGRILTICILATLIAVAICVQFIRIQNMDVAQQILDDSKAYQGVTRLVYPNRGNIYDAKGRLLAGNETTYEVGLDLNAILNGQEETIASAVSEILGMDYDKVLAYAMIEPGNGNPFYIQLDGFVSPDKILEFEALIEEYKNMELGRNQIRPRLNGLMWTAHNKRSYPEGTTGSNILGFYKYLDRTQGGMGYFGVEETYNTLLAGTPPQMVYTAFDPQKLSMLDEIPAGADIELTFNREIQAMAEQELDEAIEWSGAKGGTILIYNPKMAKLSPWPTPRALTRTSTGITVNYSQIPNLSTQPSAKLMNPVRFSKPSLLPSPWIPVLLKWTPFIQMMAHTKSVALKFATGTTVLMAT